MTNPFEARDRTAMSGKTDLSLTIDDGTEMTGAAVVVSCPRCGAPNPVAANFCHADQEPLKPGLKKPATLATAAQAGETRVGQDSGPLPVEILPAGDSSWSLPASGTPGPATAPDQEPLVLIPEGTLPAVPWDVVPVGPDGLGSGPIPVVQVEPLDGLGDPRRTWESTSPLAKDPFAELRRCCLAPMKDWAQIDFLASEARRAGLILPPELAHYEHEARRRWDCYERVQQAVEKNNLQETIAAYDPKLLDDWPACRELVLRAREARECGRKLKELRALARKGGSGQTLLGLWAQWSPVLAAWPRESEPVRRAVLALQERNRAWNQLNQLLQQPIPSERAIAQAWDQLRIAGGHPEGGKVEERARVAGLRAACLGRLPGADQPSSEEVDARMLQAWDETLLRDCPEAAGQRHRFEQARQRLEEVEALGQVIARVDQGQGREKDILDRAAALPQAYAHRHQARVALAARRANFLAKLDRALEKADPSDQEIAEFWEQACQAGARLDPAKMRRGQLANKRRQRLDQLRQMDPRLPLDQQDKRWIQEWDVPLFKDCADAQPHLARYQKAIKRIKAWNNLARAFRAKDLDQVAEWADHPLLVGYPPLERIKAEVNELVRQARELKRAKEVLHQQDLNGAVAGLDLDFIRAHPELFTAQKQAIEVLLTRWLNQGKRIEASEPAFKRDPNTGRQVVRWTWPHFKVISGCQVAISGETFFRNLADAAGQTMRWDAEAHRRVGGGLAAPPLPGKTRLFVTVWPVIDLGWTELVGPPLHLGPFRTT